MKTVLKTCMTSKVNEGNVKTTFSGVVKTRLRRSQVVAPIPPTTGGGFDYTFDFTFA